MPNAELSMEDGKRAKALSAPCTGISTDMACSRCGSDCSCACSGDPLPSLDWRRQVSLQVRAHQARKRRRLDPDAPLLDFDEPIKAAIEEDAASEQYAGAKWRWDEDIVLARPRSSADVQEDDEATELIASGTRVPQEARPEPAPLPPPEPFVSATRSQIPVDELTSDVHRPPLPPFPRVTAPAPKIIEFPRVQRQYELAEPVSDQLRIFEADEELPPPPPSHLNEIEIAPQEPAHVAAEIEVPLQTVPLGTRVYATAFDLVLMICAIGLFIACAQFFANAIPITKPLLASGAVCALLLLSSYYVLSFSFRRSTVGIDASGLRVLTFSGQDPSSARLRCRALATVLSYAALGMGFAWSLIDEDQLCWHDRITHTYLAAK